MQWNSFNILMKELYRNYCIAFSLPMLHEVYYNLWFFYLHFILKMNNKNKWGGMIVIMKVIKITMKLLFQRVQSTEDLFLESISELSKVWFISFVKKLHFLYRESIIYPHITFNETKRSLVLGKGNLIDFIHFTEHTGCCNL